VGGASRNPKTQILVTLAMLCALAYATSLLRIPAISFLRYEPKDVVILFGGFIYGPLVVPIMSIIVSTIEMFTISNTGHWGLIGNVLSTCSFAVPASLIYNRRRSISGAIAGLSIGIFFMTVIMLLWNWLVVPIYLGMPREEIEPMLFTTFLPFNLIKGSLNTVLVILLYKPLVTALRKLRLIPHSTAVIYKHKT